MASFPRTLAARGGVVAVWAGIGLFGVGGVISGCTSPRVAAQPSSGLPEYTPEEAGLFDDVMAPALFGVDVGSVDATQDRKLAQRSRISDFVVPVRVSTIARDGGELGAYRLTVEPLERPLVGYQPPGAFDLVVGRNSASYQLLDANRVAWVNTRLVLFVRRYNSGGEAVLHFRGEPDTPAVRTAVMQNALLR